MSEQLIRAKAAAYDEIIASGEDNMSQVAGDVLKLEDEAKEMRACLEALIDLGHCPACGCDQWNTKGCPVCPILRTAYSLSDRPLRKWAPWLEPDEINERNMGNVLKLEEESRTLRKHIRLLRDALAWETETYHICGWPRPNDKANCPKCKADAVANRILAETEQS